MKKLKNNEAYVVKTPIGFLNGNFMDNNIVDAINPTINRMCVSPKKTIGSPSS